MSSHFAGSIVLTQNNTGVSYSLSLCLPYSSDIPRVIQHSSLAAPSTCTARYVREYFRSGNLPAAGTVCQEDYPMFTEPDPSLGSLSFFSKGEGEGLNDEEFRKVVRELSDTYEMPSFGMIR